jgi:hypothetical protein
MQYVIDDLRAIARMAHAQAQTPKIGADVRDDVAQTVMATVAAAQLEAPLSHREIELIVRYQNFCWCDFHVIGNRAH